MTRARHLNLIARNTDSHAGIETFRICPKVGQNGYPILPTGPEPRYDRCAACCIMWFPDRSTECGCLDCGSEDDHENPHTEEEEFDRELERLENVFEDL